MFADYRVPQNVSKREELIPFCDDDEIETRTEFLLIVCYLVNQINENMHLEKDIEDQGQRLNTVVINDFLWRK
ncbi:unnamed protein product [Rotaria sordida]|uniref:Uncharacterized protein n=1 Tax=Rotaria sordida TaxID=392033 RepID=A0A814MEC6_9BILA|nr:unnamed protein product [Rotaria sordida]CAF1279645.1 unnamed protein product [Rotaria sordida]